MNSNLLNIFKNINISSIASGANKTLNIVRKSIPVYKEIRPYINHEKTIFKKDVKQEVEEKESDVSSSPNTREYNDTLTFFQ